jgi:hypothetical protein
MRLPIYRLPVFQMPSIPQHVMSTAENTYEVPTQLMIQLKETSYQFIQNYKKITSKISLW